MHWKQVYYERMMHCISIALKLSTEPQITISSDHFTLFVLIRKTHIFLMLLMLNICSFYYCFPIEFQEIELNQFNIQIRSMLTPIDIFAQLNTIFRLIILWWVQNENVFHTFVVQRSESSRNFSLLPIHHRVEHSAVRNFIIAHTIQFASFLNNSSAREIIKIVFHSSINCSCLIDILHEIHLKNATTISFAH